MRCQKAWNEAVHFFYITKGWRYWDILNDDRMHYWYKNVIDFCNRAICPERRLKCNKQNGHYMALLYKQKGFSTQSNDSPGPKSLLLEGCIHDTTGQQLWPYSSDPLWDVLQQCQNSASTTQPQLRAQKRNYYSTTFKGRSNWSYPLSE